MTHPRSKYVCNPLDPYNDCIVRKDGTHEVRHYMFPRYYQESLFDTNGNDTWNNIDCNLSLDYEGTKIFPCSPTILGIAHKAPGFKRYLGIRPYQRCKSGCHQIEYSYTHVTVNNEPYKLHYGKPTQMKHSKLIRVGSVYVQNGVANMRQLVPVYGKAVYHFDIRFDIHLMGYESLCKPATAGTVARPAIRLLDAEPTETPSGISLRVTVSEDDSSLTVHGTGFSGSDLDESDFMRCCSRTLDLVLRKAGAREAALSSSKLPMAPGQTNERVTVGGTSDTQTYMIVFDDGKAGDRAAALKAEFRKVECDAIVLTAEHVDIDAKYCFKSQNMADKFGDKPVYDIKQLRKPRLLNKHMATVSQETLHLMKRKDADTYEYRKLPSAKYLLCEAPLNRKVHYIDADTYVADEDQITHTSKDGKRRVYMSTSDHWVAMVENGVMDDANRAFDEINIVDDIDFNGKVISPVPPISNVTIRGAQSILCNAQVETTLYEDRLYCGYFSKLTNCTIEDLRIGGQLTYSMDIDTDFDGVSDYAAANYDSLTVGTMVGHMVGGSMSNVALNCTAVPIKFPNMKNLAVGGVAGRMDRVKVKNAVLGVGMPCISGGCDNLKFGIVAGQGTNLELSDVFVTCANVSRVYAIVKSSARLGGFVGDSSGDLKLVNCHMQPDTVAFDVEGTNNIKVGCISGTDSTAMTIENGTLSLYEWTLETPSNVTPEIGLVTPSSDKHENLKMFNFVRPNFYEKVYVKIMSEKLRSAFTIPGNKDEELQTFLMNHGNARDLIVQNIASLTNGHDNLMNQIYTPNEQNANSLFNKFKAEVPSLTGIQFTTIMKQWLPQMSRWLDEFMRNFFLKMDVRQDTTLSEYKAYLLENSAFKSLLQSSADSYLANTSIHGYTMRNDSTFIRRYKSQHNTTINNPFDVTRFMQNFEGILQELSNVHANRNALVHLTELLIGAPYDSTMATKHGNIMAALFSDDLTKGLMQLQYSMNRDRSEFVFPGRERTRQQLIHDSTLSDKLEALGAPAFARNTYIDRISELMHEMVVEVQNQFIRPMTTEDLRVYTIDIGNDLFDRLFDYAFEYISHYQLKEQLKFANELKESDQYTTDGSDFDLASDELFNTFLSDMKAGSLSEFMDLLAYATDQMVTNDICNSIISGLSEEEVEKSALEERIEEWLNSLGEVMTAFYTKMDEIKAKLETSITDLAARFTYDELENLKNIILSIKDALPSNDADVYPRALTMFNNEVNKFFSGPDSFNSKIIKIMADMKASRKFDYKDAVSSAQTTIAPATPTVNLVARRIDLDYDGTTKTAVDRVFLAIEPNYRQYYQYTYDDNVDGRIDLIPNEWYVISKPDNTEMTTYHTMIDITSMYESYKAGTLVNNLASSITFSTSVDESAGLERQDNNDNTYTNSQYRETTLADGTTQVTYIN